MICVACYAYDSIVQFPLEGEQFPHDLLIGLENRMVLISLPC